MSVTVSATRSADHEGEFLNFCQEVSDSVIPTPYWDRNLKQFKKVFLKYRAHGKSYLPILAFCGSKRDTLEAPIVNDAGECNDRWLQIPQDMPVPVPPTWLPVQPRGVYLPMKDDDPIHSLPLAEVYLRCLEIASGDRSYFGVSASSAPPKFLHLFYQMLNEADPENPHYLRNMNECLEMVTPSQQANPLAGALSGLSSLLTPEAQAGIQNMVAGVAGSFSEETKQQAAAAFGGFQQSGDLSSLITGFQPLLENPGIQNLFSSLTGMMSSLGVPPPKMSSEADPSTAPEAGGEDQE